MLNSASRYEDVLGSEGKHSISALDRREWWVSRLGRFIPEVGAPGNHWIRIKVGPRNCLDALEQSLFALLRNRTPIPRSANSWISLRADRAIRRLARDRCEIRKFLCGELKQVEEVDGLVAAVTNEVWVESSTTNYTALLIIQLHL